MHFCLKTKIYLDYFVITNVLEFYLNKFKQDLERKIFINQVMIDSIIDLMLSKKFMVMFRISESLTFI